MEGKLGVTEQIVCLAKAPAVFSVLFVVPEVEPRALHAHANEEKPL